MSGYVKNNWVTGDVITATKLNGMETGIYNNDTRKTLNKFYRDLLDGTASLSDLTYNPGSGTTYNISRFVRCRNLTVGSNATLQCPSASNLPTLIACDTLALSGQILAGRASNGGAGSPYGGGPGGGGTSGIVVVARQITGGGAIRANGGPGSNYVTNATNRAAGSDGGAGAIFWVTNGGGKGGVSFNTHANSIGGTAGLSSGWDTSFLDYFTAAIILQNLAPYVGGGGGGGATGSAGASAGGAGGAGLIGNGGDVLDAGSPSGSASSGGGGGGGGFVIVMSENNVPIIIVQANGGAGGNGNGVQGAEGGGGGGGGYVAVYAPASNATLSATGGAGGLANIAGGVNGNAGGAGYAGLTTMALI